MIKILKAEEVLPLRSIVLRNGLEPDKCRFEGDDDVTAVHIGYVADNEIVAVATIYEENLEDYTGAGYRLRGMASSDAVRGKGYGMKVLRHAMDSAKQRGADYMWFNARSGAIDFYKKAGFTIISEEFDVPGIGPHYNMYKQL